MKRFSLRDVFWLTLVVGMGCAWWMQSRRWATERQSLLMEARYNASLNKPLMMEITNMPLGNLVEYLSDKYGILITLDEPNLKRIGLTERSPVRLSVARGETMGDAIKRMLGKKVKLVAGDNSLLITAAE